VFLLVFVCVQLTTCALLMARGAFDLAIAAGLSAGLITAAGAYAARRPAPASRDGHPAMARIGTSDPGYVIQPVEPAQLAQAAAADPGVSTLAWADLMARISHEIRTPLNAVIGFSDLMEREIFGPLGHVRYGDYATHIKDSGSALLKSAEDTLALSSLLAGEPCSARPQTIALHDLIADAWRPLETQASRRDIALAWSAQGNAEISGDRRIIRQALLNLMTEAIDRAADGGQIDIGVEHGHDTARLTISAATAARWRHERTPSLAVCLARALLERTGTALTVEDNRVAGTWRAITVLDRPLQSDFFSAHA